MTTKEQDTVPGLAAEAVLVTSQEMAPDTDKVSGYDFNRGIDHHQLLKSFKYSGFQATNFGLAVEEIWKMIRCREENIPEDKLEIRLGSSPHSASRFNPNMCSKMNGVERNCTIFLGYTSNMASCGVRETIRYLVQHKAVLSYHLDLIMITNFHL